jgi:hypothetical protein
MKSSSNRKSGTDREKNPKTRRVLKLLALRMESNRVLHEELSRGGALSSQATMGTALELDARTLLLQPQLDYILANNEIIHALDRTPE